MPVSVIADPPTALSAIDRFDPDAVITGHRDAGNNWIDLIDRLDAKHPGLPVPS
jgi:DNA-binding NtrC family response regulator